MARTSPSTPYRRVADPAMRHADVCPLPRPALERDAERDAAVVRRTQRTVVRLLSPGCDNSMVEDLVQETYLRLFEEHHPWPADAPVEAWLMTVARQVLLDHHESEWSRPCVHPLITVDHLDPQAPGDLAECVAWRLLLDSLDNDRRLAFLLNRILGLTYEEAGTVMLSPTGTVRSRVSRARRELGVLAQDPASSPE
jgi:RNA polymerase sigma-70 factor, ECF subfamily